MTREYLTRELEESRSYSRFVKTTGKTTVYLAGVTGSDETGIEVRALDFASQTRECFVKLRDAMEAAGGQLGDIVTMTVFITDARYGDEFVKIRADYFEAGEYPASTMITVSGLAGPGMLIEIQALGVLEDE